MPSFCHLCVHMQLLIPLSVPYFSLSICWKNGHLFDLTSLDMEANRGEKEPLVFQKPICSKRKFDMPLVWSLIFHFHIRLLGKNGRKFAFQMQACYWGKITFQLLSEKPLREKASAISPISDWCNRTTNLALVREPKCKLKPNCLSKCFP